MSKKATVLWCVVLGILDAIYCIICSYIPHVQNYMWIGFISLPIFFCGGAAVKDIPKYSLCAISGVLWGALTLVLMGLGLFANPSVNMGIIVTIVVAICCSVHMAFCTEDVLGGLLSNCPMVFGGFAAIFSQGTTEIIGVIATLVLGIILGAIMGAAGPICANLIDNN